MRWSDKRCVRLLWQSPRDAAVTKMISRAAHDRKHSRDFSWPLRNLDSRWRPRSKGTQSRWVVPVIGCSGT